MISAASYCFDCAARWQRTFSPMYSFPHTSRSDSDSSTCTNCVACRPDAPHTVTAAVGTPMAAASASA